MMADDWQMEIQRAKTTGELAELTHQVLEGRNRVDRIYHDPAEDEALHLLWLSWQLRRSRP